MTVSPSAGSKVFIHAPAAGTNPVTLDNLAGWIEIGEVESLSDVGEAFGTVARTSFKRGPRVDYMKTVMNGKVVEISIGRDTSDAGQTMLTAALTSRESYLFRVTINDATVIGNVGSRIIFRALVLDLPVALGGAEDVTHRNATVQINSEVWSLPSESEADAALTLDLDFTNPTSVTPFLTYARASTATVYGVDGLIKIVPNNQWRLDHDPMTGTPRGILIEQSSTNLVPSSAVATASTGTTVNANSAVAPDGTMTADEVVENTDNSEHFVNDIVTAVTAGQSYTWSMFAKASASPRLVYIRTATAVAATSLFNLQTGAWVGAPGPTIASRGFDALPDGGYRIWISVVATVTGNLIGRTQLHNGTSPLYAGDGISGFYLWGRQLELGAVPTSYIPTAGATVTRAADNAFVTPISNWYNEANGTIYAETATNSPPGVAIVSLNRSATVVGPRMALTTTTGGVSRLSVIDTGTLNIDSGVGKRHAIAYANNDFAISTNGLSPTISSTGVVPATMTHLIIGRSPTSTQQLNGHIKRIKYYAKRLDNATLQGMTL